MKITKSRLKQIIKEELESVIQEGPIETKEDLKALMRLSPKVETVAGRVIHELKDLITDGRVGSRREAEEVINSLTDAVANLNSAIRMLQLLN